MSDAEKPVLVWHRDTDQLVFDCPGCGFLHDVRVGSGQGPRWTWNGDVARPTISPSIRVTWTYGDPPVAHCCHSFVEWGRIRYLADCTHALAGQTVPLPEAPV